MNLEKKPFQQGAHPLQCRNLRLMRSKWNISCHTTISLHEIYYIVSRVITDTSAHARDFEKASAAAPPESRHAQPRCVWRTATRLKAQAHARGKARDLRQSNGIGVRKRREVKGREEAACKGNHQNRIRSAAWARVEVRSAPWAGTKSKSAGPARSTAPHLSRDPGV